MGKFTAIQTYSRFLSLWEENKINRNSLTFILDTGQLYTHGIFLNSVAYGAEANGAIDITIAGTSKSLSLSSHTHSNYLEKNKNIDIGTYKIVSGDKDLLYYNAGNTYLGNSTSPVYLVGTEGKIVKGNTAYTLLDTDNFSILSQTANGIILSNSALFKYADKTFSIDYIKRYNSTSNFDSLNSVTSAGTTTVNGKKYGFMTFYEEGAVSPSWSLIRIDVADRKLEFRTSSNPTTWVSPAAASIPENTATVAGIVSAPGTNNSGKVWKTDANGTPAWRSEVSNTWRNIRINDEENDSLTTGTGTGALYIKLGSGITVAWQGNKIVISNASPNIWKAANTLLEGYIPKLTTDGGTISTQASEYVLTYVSSNTGTVTPVWKLLPAKAFENTWNANAVNVAGYVAAPTKADNANMTWQTDAEGVPAWRASNNHNHDGRYLYWAGNTANAVAMGWGTLTSANGYTILSHASSSDGGDWGMVNKGGQIFMLLDGMYYQREGAYRCLDTGDWISPGNRNSIASKIVTTDANGYIQTGWINTISGDMGATTMDRIYCSDDGYIRYKTPAQFTKDIIAQAGLTTATITKSLTPTTSWGATGIGTSDLTTGTYAIQVVQGTHYYSGILSWYANTGGMAEEIDLHYNGSGTPTRIYLRTYNGLLLIAADAAYSSTSFTFNFRKLI